MILRTRPFVLGTLCAATMLAFSGCGGDGGGTSPPPAMKSLATTVLDGAIQNARVCLDVDLDGLCGADEPSSRTDVSGQATLEVAAADIGAYPLVAMVGDDAVDADTGPVTTPYVMMAPKDRTGVVSPLTTLVQTTVAGTGISTEDAALVLAGSGLPGDPFMNYANPADPAAHQAAAVAFALAEFQRQQLDAMAGMVGEADPSGAPIVQADLYQVAAAYALQNLAPVVAAALGALQDSGGEMNPAAIGAIGPAVASVASAPTLQGVGGTLMAMRSDAVDTDNRPGAANAALDQLDYTDPDNWFYFALTQTTAQATPDGEGNTRFQFARARSTDGSVVRWTQTNFGPERDGDLHWSDKAWTDCSAGGVIGPRTETPDGGNVFDASSCDGQTINAGKRAYLDVSGRLINEILPLVRAVRAQADFVASVPAADARFPDGSLLQFSQDTAVATAPTYIPSDGPVRVYPAGVAAGGDARVNPGVACNAAALPDPTAASGLDALVATMKGTPCLFDRTSGPDSGTRNEWWSNSTLSWAQLGSQPLSDSADNYYTSNIIYRVAFGSGSQARFFSCQQRARDGSVRNCDQVGTGTYAITTLGDARVMQFAGVPVAWRAGLGWDRVFVERGGRVYYGYKNQLGVRETRRLNLPATNALFDALGIPQLTP